MNYIYVNDLTYIIKSTFRILPHGYFFGVSLSTDKRFEIIIWDNVDRRVIDKIPIAESINDSYIIQDEYKRLIENELPKILVLKSGMIVFIYDTEGGGDYNVMNTIAYPNDRIYFIMYDIVKRKFIKNIYIDGITLLKFVFEIEDDILVFGARVYTVVSSHKRYQSDDVYRLNLKTSGCMRDDSDAVGKKMILPSTNIYDDSLTLMKIASVNDKLKIMVFKIILFNDNFSKYHNIELPIESSLVRLSYFLSFSQKVTVRLTHYVHLVIEQERGDGFKDILVFSISDNERPVLLYSISVNRMLDLVEESDGIILVLHYNQDDKKVLSRYINGNLDDTFTAEGLEHVKPIPKGGAVGFYMIGPRGGETKYVIRPITGGGLLTKRAILEK